MTPDKLPKDIQGMDFETAIAELESIASDMQSEKLTLEQSVNAYKRAKALSERCRGLLEEARGLVERLDGDGELVPMDPAPGHSDAS